MNCISFMRNIIVKTVELGQDAGNTGERSIISVQSKMVRVSFLKGVRARRVS